MLHKLHPKKIANLKNLVIIMILIGLIWIGIKIKITTKIKIHLPLNKKESLLIIKKEIIFVSKIDQQAIEIMTRKEVIRIKIKNKVK